MTATDQPARRATSAWSLARGRAAAASVPMAVWVGVAVLVVVSTVGRFLLARGVTAPFIFQDELLYSELAKSFGTTGHFAMRGVPGLFGLSPAYPVLISPAYALFDRAPDAYTAIKFLNALFVSLSAVPAYLVARRLVSPWLAFLAAVLVLAVPDLLLVGTVMTENAFYPIFLFWFLVLVRMLERPTILNQVGALALLLVAYETRPQALVLGPALLTAIVLVVLAEGLVAAERRSVMLRRARAYWLTYVLVAAGALFFVLVEVLIRGQAVKQSLLKTYSSLAEVNYTFGGVAKWTLYLLGELDIVLGVLPLAALVVVAVAAFRREESSPALRAYAAGAVAASVWIMLAVGAFSSGPYVRRLEERNAFYVMPLLLIALVVWASRYSGRLPRATGIAAMIAVACTGLVPLARFLNGDALTDSFALLGVWRLQMHFAVSFEWLTPLILVLAIGAGIFFVLVPPRFALVAPALVFLLLVVENRGADLFIAQTSTDARKGGIRANVDWIDRAVGSHGKTAILFTNARPPAVTWQNEFFNRSVGTLYNFVTSPLDGLPQQMITIDRHTGLMKVAGDGVAHAQYAVTDTTQALAGPVVAADPSIGMRLYRVNGPIRVRGSFTGIYPDFWSGSSASLLVYACHGDKLILDLKGEPRVQRKPVTVVATSEGRRLARLVVPPGFAVRRYTIPVVSRGGACRVDFAISPTSVPDKTLGNDDLREVGLRFMGFSMKR